MQNRHRKFQDITLAELNIKIPRFDERLLSLRFVFINKSIIRTLGQAAYLTENPGKSYTIGEASKKPTVSEVVNIMLGMV